MSGVYPSDDQKYRKKSLHIVTHDALLFYAEPHIIFLLSVGFVSVNDHGNCVLVDLSIVCCLIYAKILFDKSYELYLKVLYQIFKLKL